MQPFDHLQEYSKVQITGTMVKSVVLSFTLIFAATVAGSLFDASANRELARMKKLVEITHDQILEEKCPNPDVKVAKRNLLQDCYIGYGTPITYSQINLYPASFIRKCWELSVFLCVKATPIS